MPSVDQVNLNGTVTKALPSATFEVELQNKQIVTAYLSGKIRKNKITILPGDNVMLELSPYDLTKARIVFRVSGTKKRV